MSFDKKPGLFLGDSHCIIENDVNLKDIFQDRGYVAASRSSYYIDNRLIVAPTHNTVIAEDILENATYCICLNKNKSASYRFNYVKEYYIQLANKERIFCYTYDGIGLADPDLNLLIPCYNKESGTDFFADINKLFKIISNIEIDETCKKLLVYLDLPGIYLKIKLNDFNRLINHHTIDFEDKVRILNIVEKFNLGNLS